MPENNKGQVLTPEQTAEYLAVTHKTLSNWRTLGKGPDFIKLGSSVRYLKEDLDDFIESNRVRTGGGVR